jgi:modulator of FtsH protease
MISATAPTLAMNRVLRNTYALLALTLLFSAFTAGLSMVFNWPYPGLVLTLVGYFGLLFLTSRFRDSGWGLLCVFALTGFMGITLGPIINYYLIAVHNGAQLVATALGMTGGIFLVLSGYVLTTRRDFSFMGGMLMVGILVAFLSGLGLVVASMFGMEVSGAMLGISALFVLLMCGLILYQTSAIIHGGETNYIMATVTLYVSLYNLFTSLLHLLAAFGGDD